MRFGGKLVASSEPESWLQQIVIMVSDNGKPEVSMEPVMRLLSAISSSNAEGSLDGKLPPMEFVLMSRYARAAGSCEKSEKPVNMLELTSRIFNPLGRT